MHPDERMSARHHAGDQVIDEGIPAAQGREIELGRIEESAAGDTAAVPGIEHDRELDAVGSITSNGGSSSASTGLFMRFQAFRGR